jgi:hypothetical protein
LQHTADKASGSRESSLLHCCRSLNTASMLVSRTLRACFVAVPSSACKDMSTVDARHVMRGASLWANVDTQRRSFNGQHSLCIGRDMLCLPPAVILCASSLPVIMRRRFKCNDAHFAIYHEVCDMILGTMQLIVSCNDSLCNARPEKLIRR